MDIGNDHVWRFHAYRKGFHGLAFRHHSQVANGRSVYVKVFYLGDVERVTTEPHYDRSDLRSRPNWDLP